MCFSVEKFMTSLVAALLSSVIPLAAMAHGGDDNKSKVVWPFRGGDLSNNAHALGESKIRVDNISDIMAAPSYVYQTSSDDPKILSDADFAGGNSGAPASIEQVNGKTFLYLVDWSGHITKLKFKKDTGFTEIWKGRFRPCEIRSTDNLGNTDPICINHPERVYSSSTADGCVGGEMGNPSNHNPDMIVKHRKGHKIFKERIPQNCKRIDLARSTPAIGKKYVFVGNNDNTERRILDGDIHKLSTFYLDEDNQAVEGDRFIARDGAVLVAINKKTGKLGWSTVLDNHPLAIITNSPIVYNHPHYGEVIYVGIATHWEQRMNPDDEAPRTGQLVNNNKIYNCCTFRGSVVAVKASTGKILWKRYTLPIKFAEDELDWEKRPTSWGPTVAEQQSGLGEDVFPSKSLSGASVWGSSFSISKKRNALYIATGNMHTVPLGDFSYPDPETGKQTSIDWNSVPRILNTSSCEIGRRLAPEADGGDDLEINSAFDVSTGRANLIAFLDKNACLSKDNLSKAVVALDLTTGKVKHKWQFGFDAQHVSQAFNFGNGPGPATSMTYFLEFLLPMGRSRSFYPDSVLDIFDKRFFAVFGFANYGEVSNVDVDFAQAPMLIKNAKVDLGNPLEGYGDTVTMDVLAVASKDGRLHFIDPSVSGSNGTEGVIRTIIVGTSGLVNSVFGSATDGKTVYVKSNNFDLTAQSTLGFPSFFIGNGISSFYLCDNDPLQPGPASPVNFLGMYPPTNAYPYQTTAFPYASTCNVATGPLNLDDTNDRNPGDGRVEADGIVISAIDVETGNILWQSALKNTPFTGMQGGVSVANGVVFTTYITVGADSSADDLNGMLALDAKTGEIKADFRPSSGDLRARPTIHDGVIFWGSGYRCGEDCQKDLDGFLISDFRSGNQFFAFVSPDAADDDDDDDDDDHHHDLPWWKILLIILFNLKDHIG